MPLDPSLSLQVKPVQIEPTSATDLFKTLAQIKYLQASEAGAQAQTQALQEEAARKQQVFGEQGAAGQLLSSLRSRPAVAPEPGGASAGPSPAPGGGAVDLLHPDVQATIYRVAPHAAPEIIKSLYDRADQQVKMQQQQFDLVKSTLGVAGQLLAAATDEPSWQLARGLIGQLGGNVAAVPEHFSPAAKQYMAETTRTVQDRVAEVQKNFELQTQRLQAEAAKQTAQTGAAAEQRLGTEVMPVPMAEGGPATIQRFGGGVSQPGGQGMTLEQSNARAGHEANLAGQFRELTGAYDEVRDGLTLVRSAREVDPQDPRASDQVLLNGFAKLVNGATNPRLATVLSPEKRDSLLGQLTQFKDQLTKGASLSPQQRQAILSASEEVAAAQERNYNGLRDQFRTRAKGLPNVRPEVVAPDFVRPTGAAGAPASAPRATSGGRSISLSEFEELLKHPAVQGKTRAQVVSDLAKKGIRVRPDEVTP
jgi:hypothetical protein